jgi:hypothetical protein
VGLVNRGIVGRHGGRFGRRARRKQRVECDDFDRMIDGRIIF